MKQIYTYKGRRKNQRMFSQKHKDINLLLPSLHRTNSLLNRRYEWYICNMQYFITHEFTVSLIKLDIILLLLLVHHALMQLVCYVMHSSPACALSFK